MMNTRLILAHFSIAVFGGAPLLAQAAVRFEVVSVKPNRSGLPNSETNTSPGRFDLVNATTLSLLLRAFGVRAPQIVDAPGWVASERYDVLAVTGGADRLNDQDRQQPIQAMLADRWQLRFHRSTKPLTVYVLRAAADGPKIRTNAGAGTYSMKVTPADGRLVLNATRGNIPRLVEILSGAIGNIVVNETALDGEYDFTLDWAQDLGADATGPALATALREQLGLRLEPVKRDVEVIVVDSISRPSPN